jgi:large subunit ribosomal protein L24
MKIKKGDNVIVTTGSDKGKSGKVFLAIPKENKILIEGINMKKKHQRRGGQSQKGQIVDRPKPIDVSNVKLSDVVSKPKRTKKVKDNK